MADPYEPYYDDGNPYASPPPGEWEPPPLALTEAEKQLFRKRLAGLFINSGVATTVFVVGGVSGNLGGAFPKGFTGIVFLCLIVASAVCAVFSAVAVYQLNRMLKRPWILNAAYTYIALNPLIALIAAWELKVKFDKITTKSERDA